MGSAMSAQQFLDLRLRHVADGLVHDLAVFHDHQRGEMCIRDSPMTEREFEKAFGVRRCTVHYYKGSALEKLREMLSENV